MSINGSKQFSLSNSSIEGEICFKQPIDQEGDRGMIWNPKSKPQQ
jgi:hypothetical protein